MEWKKHCYRVGSHTFEADDLPTDASELDLLVGNARKQIEPWLSAVFQAEHLNVVLGSGFTTAIALKAGGGATGMSKVKFGSKFDAQIDLHATASAKAMGRGEPNIEDQFRSALAVYEGLLVIDAAAAAALKDKLDQELSKFLKSLLATEKQIAAAASPEAQVAANTPLQSFLLSCASRAASRERLHIFTTNYDRLISTAAIWRDFESLIVSLEHFRPCLDRPEWRSTSTTILREYPACQSSNNAGRARDFPLDVSDWTRCRERHLRTGRRILGKPR